MTYFPIFNCATTVPGFEYSIYSKLKLFHWIFRKHVSGMLSINGFVAIYQIFKMLCIKVDVIFYPNFFFKVLDGILKIFVANTHNHITKHIYETTIAVIHKTLISCFFDECINNMIIDPKV